MLWGRERTERLVVVNGSGVRALPRIDISRPHSARVYDYFLGGKDNFTADREAAQLILRSCPSARVAARENRKFLARTVGYLARHAGIRQFLDIGAGLPGANNTHEVAQRIAPDSRVVYADNDPLVLAHVRALLTSSPYGRTRYIEADLREPGKILANRVVRETIDFTRPVALMLAAVLHFIADADNPGAIVRTLLGALPPGSYLAASQVTPEHDPVGVRGMVRAYRSAGMTAQSRTVEEFGRLAFSGLDLVAPGLVLVSEWRPADGGPRPRPEEVNCYGAVARKPPVTR